MLIALKKELGRFADPIRAKNLQWFFKTAKGEYGYGDIFIGLSVPQIRQVVKKFADLDLVLVRKLLQSKIHEYRLAALLILVLRYAKANPREQKKIFQLYLKSSRHINNWDLVDLTAHRIVGAYLADKPRGLLVKLARSKNLWQRRIAIIATAYYIGKCQFFDTLKIAKILLNDPHDLIHKAVGWMLREVGKRDLAVEEKFLKQYYHKMPRTMLRYAIEKFPESLRQQYLLRR